MCPAELSSGKHMDTEGAVRARNKPSLLSYCSSWGTWKGLIRIAEQKKYPELDTSCTHVFLHD